MNVDERREATRQLYRHAGGYELAFSPVLMALLGLWLDRMLGITPALTITFAVVAFVGVVVKLWFTYSHEMRQYEEVGPWAKR